MTESTEIQEIVIITGASSGIGVATVRELVRQGFQVLAGVRRGRDAEAIRGSGIEPLILDITKRDHIRTLATRVQEDPQCRSVRALVNNAGIGVYVPFEAFAIDEWRRLFEVNLFGHVAVTQALLPALTRSKGRVINISSVGGKVAVATYGPYAATKFALEAVSDSLLGRFTQRSECNFNLPRAFRQIRAEAREAFVEREHRTYTLDLSRRLA